MTAAQLFSYITVALLLQVVAGVAFAVWRRPSTAGAPMPVEVEHGVAPGEIPSGAWSGWCDFLVVRRGFEDVAQTQCSFHLQPVDGAPLNPYMQAKHREEGVSESLDNCVRCHRSASGEGEGKGQRDRGKGGRERD